MQQIADWLEKLGMSEYAQRFAENDIDFTILADLTDEAQPSTIARSISPSTSVTARRAESSSCSRASTLTRVLRYCRSASIVFALRLAS